MSTYDAQLDRIREKLSRVQGTKPEEFGAGAHGYTLGPPILEQQVRRFEEKHGIELPACYRAFITRIGYGGRGEKIEAAGPYYGLYRLADWNDYPSWIFDDVEDDWLSLECPLVPGRNDLPELTEEEEDDPDWPDKIVRLYRGIMTIGTRGCTYMTGLVVTGECRGRVVYVDAQQCEPPYVGRDADFLCWYERWLDELLGGYRTMWFGYGPPGDESELLGIAEGSDDQALRAEAVSNLGKLPTRSAEVWLRLGKLAADPFRDVRRNAAWLLRFAPAGVLSDFVGLFDDDDATVRKQAYMSFVQAAPAVYGEEVKQRADSEANAEAKRAAYVELRGAGLVDEVKPTEDVE